MKHYTIRELTKSRTAAKLGIDNTPTPEITRRLNALVDKVLDPLREKFGAPIIVTSGYRSPKVNAATPGASKTSQHMQGEAADIRTVSDSREDNMKLLRCLLQSGIEFDQIICEYPDANGRPDWIHVSYTTRRANRKVKTTCRGGKYYSGIKL